MTLTNGRPPDLQLPKMGPLTRATLLYDFATPNIDPEDLDWNAEIPAIINHRLAALTQRMLRDLAIQPPPGVARQLQEAVFAWTEASAIVTKRAMEDLNILREHGIEFVITKGPGIAATTRRMAERPYMDIDVFVAAERFHLVLDLLAKSGYREEDKNAIPRPGLSQICREAVNLRNPSGGSIDIHHRIPPWLWGSHVLFEDVLAESQSQSIPGGGVLPCASAADNLLVSALHIVSDKNSPGNTLMAWRDVLVLAHAADQDHLVLRARRSQLCGWVSWIMGALPQNALPDGLSDRLAAVDRRVPHQHRLGAVMPPGFASGHSVFSQLCRLPLPNAAQFLVGLVWPSSEFLEKKVGHPPHPRFRWLWAALANGDIDV